MSVLAVEAVARPAFADDAEDSKKALSLARAKFQQGVESEQASDWVGALRLFREVAQTKMTPQVRFHIAVCEENLGHLVKALGGYQLALEEAKDPSAVPEVFRTQDLADRFRTEVEGSIGDLQTRLPQLTIQRGPGAEAATIELDGVPLGASSIGVEVPQDPGPHLVTARSPGYSNFSETVTLAEKENKTVSVTLKKNPEAEDQVAIGGTGGGGVHDTGPHKPSRLVPYVIGGAGVASLAASGVLFLLRQRNLSDLEDRCGTDGNCYNNGLSQQEIADARDKYDAVKTYGLFGLVTAGVGVAAIGTAVTLIVLEPKPKKPPVDQAARWRGVQIGLAPTAPGADIAGASLVGRF